MCFPYYDYQFELHHRAAREQKTGKCKIQKNILKLISIEDIGESAILKSVQSMFKDLEDEFQNFWAEENGHKIIITRNIKDYKESDLAILTPKEFLIKISPEIS